MAEWTNARVCKTRGASLRGFESLPQHTSTRFSVRLSSPSKSRSVRGRRVEAWRRDEKSTLSLSKGIPPPASKCPDGSPKRIFGLLSAGWRIRIRKFNGAGSGRARQTCQACPPSSCLGSSVAERFLGKKEVVGSIPTLGSVGSKE